MTGPIVGNGDGTGRSSVSGGGGSFGMSNQVIVKLLQKRGVSKEEISRFLATGTPSQAITNVLSPSQIQQISSTVKPKNTPSQKPMALSFGNVPQPAASPGPLSYNNPYGSPKGTGNSDIGAMVGGGLRNLAQISAKRDDMSSIGEAVGGGLKGLAKKLLTPTTKAAPSAPEATMDSPFPTGGAMEQYSAPVVSPRDFTSEAQGMAANAYAPFYAAIAAGKVGANNQYSSSDQVVKGLYDKLVADTQASGQQQAAQYDQAGVDAQARSKALQDRQAQVYGDTANQQTELLQKLGQQVSAQDVLGGGMQEQAFQQSQAAQQGTAQQDYYAAGKQAANDYTTGIGNAQNTAGTAAREDLVRELNSVLGQYDQQQLMGKQQEGMAAIDIGSDLTNRDLQAQTTNAGNSMSAAQMNQSAAQQALAAQQDAWKMQYQMGQDRLGQSNLDRNYNLQENQFKLDNAAATAEAQASGMPEALSFDDMSPVQQISRQADESDPGKGTAYVDMFNAIVNAPGVDLDSMNPQTFGVRAAQLAKQYGLSPGVAFAAAVSYYQKVMNRK